MTRETEGERGVCNRQTDRPFDRQVDISMSEKEKKKEKQIGGGGVDMKI